MNTCGTCKYFGKAPVNELVMSEGEPDYGLRESRYHPCELIKHRHRPYAVVPEPDLACVIDGSDYVAVFCVSEEFGCNQWQAAAQQKTESRNAG